ncbi:MAG TPA: Fe-S cluster assembly ATPase SufC [Clostridiaceae bacterium]|nr:Fe-S cluster assembly ATPase SufC [Clostridiaceae bacterium]
MSVMLEVSDLKVAVDDVEILQGVDLEIRRGEVHVLMGPNGAGKSTLARTIMADPQFEQVEGDIYFEGENINDFSTDERAKLGIFLTFQNPLEVAGISVEDFLRTTKMELTGEDISIIKFKRELQGHMQDLDLNQIYAERYLNVGFSGGEKKKGEILQMSVLNPDLVMLDEPDSGLDVDAVRIVSQTVADFLSDKKKSCLIITHHSVILESVKPDFAHILIDGKIVKRGGPELIERVNNEGYNWIREELGLEKVHDEVLD